MTLSFEGLAKAYPPSPPLFQGLNLELSSGERIALVGDSGCGKSTLLRLLSGLSEPDAGVIRRDGAIVGAPGRPVEAWKAKIGLVFQEAALFPHLNVVQNVGFGLPRSPNRAQIVEDCLAMVGLGGLGQRFPHELSGGQQQRVGLARALAPQPAFLLLDEPFSGLDSRTKHGLMDDLESLFDRLGTGVLLVTHDTEDALRLAHRVVELVAGNLVTSRSSPGE